MRIMTDGYEHLRKKMAHYLELTARVSNREAAKQFKEMAADYQRLLDELALKKDGRDGSDE